MEEKVIEAYIRYGSIEKVAKELGVPRSMVKGIIEKECGIISSYPGLCRLHLLMKNKCFISASEAKKLLNITKQAVYYLFREIVDKTNEYRIAVFTLKRPLIYLVKYRDACIDEFINYITNKYSITRTDAEERIEWR